MTENEKDVIAPGIPSQKDDKDIVGVEQADIDVDDTEEGPRLSTAKIVALAAGMMMTFFVGVSVFYQVLRSTENRQQGLIRYLFNRWAILD